MWPLLQRRTAPNPEPLRVCPAHDLSSTVLRASMTWWESTWQAPNGLGIVHRVNVDRIIHQRFVASVRFWNQVAYLDRVFGSAVPG